MELIVFYRSRSQEGYAIYIVTGPIPDCQADQLLRLSPAVQNERPKLLGEVGSSGQGRGSSGQAASGSGQSAEAALMDSARGLAMANQPAASDFGGRYIIQVFRFIWFFFRQQIAKFRKKIEIRKCQLFVRSEGYEYVLIHTYEKMLGNTE